MDNLLLKSILHTITLLNANEHVYPQILKRQQPKMLVLPTHRRQSTPIYTRKKSGNNIKQYFKN